jgi:glucose uptake protein GlcU
MAGDLGIGLLYCVAAGIGLGIQYLPVKRVAVADGVFFAFCMSLGIMAVGIVLSFAMPTESTAAVTAMPRFEPMAMLGGAASMIGNLMIPVAINLVGLGVSTCVTDLSEMLMGWGTGKFGLLLVPAQTVSSEPLNYTGLAFIIASLVMFSQARDLPSREQADTPEKSRSEARDVDTESATSAQTQEQTAPTIETSDTDTAATGDSHEVPCSKMTNAQPPALSEEQAAQAIETSDIERGTDGGRRESTGSEDANTHGDPRQARWFAGFLLCILSGAFTGNQFTPTVILAEFEEHSSDHLDYIWSNFAGMTVTSSAVLLLYMLIRRQKVHTPKAVVLPAFASGAIGALALAAFFKANQELSMVISVPIVDSLPGMVALSLGVFVFGEIRTKRGRAFAAAGMLIRLVAVVLVALSD